MREYICIYDEDEMQFIPSPYADTEELIRCKDCKHHHYENNKIPYCNIIDYGYGWKDDDFCSMAERKEE